MKLFLLMLVALDSLSFADGLPTVPYLYVQGSAEVEKKADLISLRFKLSEVNKDVTAANKAVQTQAGKVFELLKVTGVAEGDVVASGIRSEAEYDEAEGNGRRKFLGYRVERDFTAKVRELEKFPKLLNDLFALKVSFFEGMSAEYSKAKDVKNETWALALKNAGEEADHMAKAAGMKVDSVWALSPEPFPSIKDRILGEHNSLPGAALSVMSGGKKTKDEAPPEYRLAPVTFSQSVHAIFLISPAK